MTSQLFPANAHVLFIHTLRASMAFVRRLQANPGQLPDKSDKSPVSEADIQAENYARLLLTGGERTFPGAIPTTWGVYGEERGEHRPCQGQLSHVRVCLDIIDGTKAYLNQWSFGTMVTIAVTLDDQLVIAVYVGDIHTDHIYYYNPRVVGLHCISPLKRDYRGEPVRIDTTRPLNQQFALLRDDRETYGPMLDALVRPGTGVFKGTLNQPSHSIASTTILVCTGAVAALFLKPHKQLKLWDEAVTQGLAAISGLVYLRPNADGGLEEYLPVLPLPGTTDYREHPAIVTPAAYAEELKAAVRRR